ncbi:chorismate-binding protein [Streptomyces sp. NPDC059786]|uniref:chorismate-binding protein n=1 Tax=Streptomyces sp. NPDC059786 TaxID=3346946 RepID=UPI003661D0EF
MGGDEPMAYWSGTLATRLLDVTRDPSALDSTGYWVTAVSFEGEVICARFRDVRRVPAVKCSRRPWHGPRPEDWSTSLRKDEYIAAVARIRERIAAGDIYQANLCRLLSAPIAPDSDIMALADLLRRHNPAPFAGTIRLPAHGVEVTTASPELFVRRRGRTVTSMPIKGTGQTEADLLEKDQAENVMIVDLVRNDLGQVCTPGSIQVPDLCTVQQHPGLVHLVSSVDGELAPDAGWPQLLRATFPPGSVTGTPKKKSLELIEELERGPRGLYCGAIGWVDADRRHGELAVGIRTFFINRPEGLLRFGTGAGITWGSDPLREWEETELKARRLLAIASRPDIERRAPQGVADSAGL